MSHDDWTPMLDGWEPYQGDGCGIWPLVVLVAGIVGTGWTLWEILT